MKRKTETRNKYNKVNPKSKTKVPEVKIETYTKVTYRANSGFTSLHLSLADNVTDTLWRLGRSSCLSRRSSIPALLPLLEDPGGVRIPNCRRFVGV